MADFNSNNQDTRRHVQTNNQTYYNPKMEKPSALSVVYYDDSVRLSFAPELPKEQQTERRKYDYDKAVITSLYRQKCNELYNAYVEKIVPAIQEGRNEQVSIPLAGVNQLMIDTNVDTNGTPRPRIKLIKNIDANSLIADSNNVISYEFNTGEYILGYDETTGNYSDRVVTYNELKLFMKDLITFAEASSNAFIHTDRVVNKYWKDSIDNKLNQIGEKNGLDLTYKARVGTGNGNQNPVSIFSKPSNQESTPTSTISSLDQLEAELPFN